MATNDDTTYVVQTGMVEYMVHQFKNFVGTRPSCNLYWNGKSDLAPSASIVKLQAYNQVTTTWTDVDTDNVTGAETDFDLNGSIPDLTNFVDNGVVSCRVWQQAL